MNPTTRWTFRTLPPLALSVLAGLLNIAVFPRIDLGWLAFVCILPLFLLLERRTSRQLFFDFWFAAFIFRAGNLYWIAHVIGHYTDVSYLVSSGIVVLLCIYLGCFWGISGVILGSVTRRAGLHAALLLAPFLWVAQEYMLNIIRFPWDLLGYSQYSHLRIAQIASIFGVYGLTWLLVACNAALAILILRRKYYYGVSTICMLVAATSYGHWRISQPAGGETLRVGVVQGNIPQDVKIDYKFADDINRLHIRMTEELAREEHPDIIFWSESSTLYPVLAGGGWSSQLQGMARRTGIPVFVGSDQYTTDDVYNSSFLLQPDGTFYAEDYSKIYLVPFGEYVPFKDLLFFANKVVPEISDFTPGYKYTLFPVKGKKFAVNICFEVVFPQLAQTLTKKGGSLLTTITNDAWFGHTCAPYQHFAMAAMRSIENRRYLVRAANTGISGIVDPYGRVLRKTGIFEPAKFAEDVRWVDEQTFYTRHGDILVYISFFLTAIILLVPRGRIKGDTHGTGSKTDV